MKRLIKKLNLPRMSFIAFLKRLLKKLLLPTVTVLCCVGLFYTLAGDIDYQDSSSFQKYEIQLQPRALIFYTSLSLVRILIALLLSLGPAVYIGSKMHASEENSGPQMWMLDILQSIPLEVFLVFINKFFLLLFPHSLWGAQLSVIISLITAQIWNLILIVYTSRSSQPRFHKDLKKLYRISPTTEFWYFDLPSLLPKLITNCMLSISASWFLITAAEEIFVNDTGNSFILPGLGGVIKKATELGRTEYVLGAILAITVATICCNAFILNPLLYLARNYIPPHLEIDIRKWVPKFNFSKISAFIWNRFTLGLLSLATIYYIKPQLLFLQILPRMLCTSCRVFMVLLGSSIIGLPLGICIGVLSGRIKDIAQLWLQILSSIPINIIYAGIYVLASRYSVPFEICCLMMMILGPLWCVVYNVLEATNSIQEDYFALGKTCRLSPYQMLHQIILPSMLEPYLTGLLAASGAAWNSSLLCEVLSWKGHRFQVYGIGSYMVANNDTLSIACSVITMCGFIYCINVYFWTPLLRYVKKFFKI